MDTFELFSKFMVIMRLCKIIMSCTSFIHVTLKSLVMHVNKFVFEKFEAIFALVLSGVNLCTITVSRGHQDQSIQTNVF